MRLCASCIGMDFNNPVLSSDKDLPKWLENVNYVNDFIKNWKSFKLKKNKDTIKITFTVPPIYVGKYVLYWAAKPTKNDYKIVDAKRAYGNFSNCGVSKVGKDCLVRLYVYCPQNYRTITKGGKTEEIFYRHVHFCFQKSVDEWDTKHVFTKVVTCSIPWNSIDDKLLLNTLPKKEFERHHIPGSFHLDASMVRKMSREDLHDYFIKLVRENPRFHKIQKALQSGDLFWYAIPIVLYCKNKSCHASDKCLSALYKKGIVNVKIYRGGIDAYDKSKKI